MFRRLAALVSLLILATAFAAPVQAFQAREGRGGYGGHPGYGGMGGGPGGRGGFGGDAGGYGHRGGYVGGRGGFDGQRGFGAPSGYGPGGYTRRENAYPERRPYIGPEAYRGPPTPEALSPRGYRSGGGYAPGRWARGQFLPMEARGQVIQDPDRYHLRRPPRGYYWYQSGDEYVLASNATGVIFEVISADDF